MSADPAAPLLSVRGLSRRYGDRVALDGLSFDLAAGELLAFLGPNGAGKTTAFEILTGLRRADAGEVRLSGQLMAPGAAELRARIGVVFQRPAIDEKLTARENLLLGAALMGVSRAAARPRIEAALLRAELSARGDEQVAKFSGGLRQRLELERALLGEPDLLILDEPTQGLDPGFRRTFWRGIREACARRGLAVLLTTHDPHEAAECDRVAVLDAGRIVAEGTPRALCDRLGGDVLVVEAERPDELAPVIRERFGVEPHIEGDTLRFTLPRAHEAIPRLVEALPPGRLTSVGLHLPTLADVFVHLTGRALGAEDAPAP